MHSKKSLYYLGKLDIYGSARMRPVLNVITYLSKLEYGHEKRTRVTYTALFTSVFTHARVYHIGRCPVLDILPLWNTFIRDL